MLITAKEQFLSFFHNPILIACIFSWFSAQFIKAVIKLLSGKVHTLQELFELLLWRTGSMPSSHAAFVACLCTGIGFHSGVTSDVFILALGFYFVTIRDAVGVRRANGIQAKVLNEVGTELDKKDVLSFKPIKEVQGHKPMEVIIGSLLGFFNGIAFSVL